MKKVTHLVRTLRILWDVFSFSWQGFSSLQNVVCRVVVFYQKTEKTCQNTCSITELRFNVKKMIFITLFIVCSFAKAGTYEDYFRAIELDDDKTVIALLARGLDPSIVEAQEGQTGLMWAITHNSQKVMSVFLALPEMEWDGRARNGNTALMLATYKKQAWLVRELLKKGARVNQSGWTALHYAAYVGDDESIKLLLNYSAKLDALSPNGTTPLMMAAHGGQVSSVKLLLDYGASLTLKNEHGMSVIDFAKEVGANEIVKNLQVRLQKVN